MASWEWKAGWGCFHASVVVRCCHTSIDIDVFNVRMIDLLVHFCWETGTIGCGALGIKGAQTLLRCVSVALHLWHFWLKIKRLGFYTWSSPGTLGRRFLPQISRTEPLGKHMLMRTAGTVVMIATTSKPQSILKYQTLSEKPCPRNLMAGASNRCFPTKSPALYRAPARIPSCQCLRGFTLCHVKQILVPLGLASVLLLVEHFSVESVVFAMLGFWQFIRA